MVEKTETGIVARVDKQKTKFGNGYIVLWFLVPLILDYTVRKFRIFNKELVDPELEISKSCKVTVNILSVTS